MATNSDAYFKVPNKYRVTILPRTYEELTGDFKQSFPWDSRKQSLTLKGLKGQMMMKS